MAAPPDEAEGQVERVHENLAEELGFEAQPVQFLRDGVLAEVEEARVGKGLLVVDMGEVVVGGREEHVESRLKSRHVVAAPVPLVDVVSLVQEEPLCQELEQLCELDGKELQRENDHS